MPYAEEDLHFLDPNRRWTIMQKCVMPLPSASEATLGPPFLLTIFVGWKTSVEKNVLEKRMFAKSSYNHAMESEIRCQ